MRVKRAKEGIDRRGLQVKYGQIEGCWGSQALSSGEVFVVGRRKHGEPRGGGRQRGVEGLCAHAEACFDVKAEAIGLHMHIDGCEAMRGGLLGGACKLVDGGLKSQLQLCLGLLQE